MTPLSVVIITFNEERNIGRCLDSVRGIADEIVVVDSGSTDRTVEICRSAGARIVVHPFKGHIEQKNHALTLAGFPHVLSVDADEALSEGLKEEIRAVKESWQSDAYAMKRLTNYCGTWIRHGGWYPDWKIRLFDKRKGTWGGVNPHDRIVLQPGSTTGALGGDLLHYSYYTVSDHLRQIDYFTDISADALMQRGRRPSFIRMLAGPLFRFVRDFVFRLGFLDGSAGLRIAVLSSYAVFIKHAKHRDRYESG